MSSVGLQIIYSIIVLFLSIDTIGLCNNIGYLITKLIIFSKLCFFSYVFKFFHLPVLFLQNYIQILKAHFLKNFLQVKYLNNLLLHN